MFQGLYINLDKRADRRAHMEREIASFGLSDRYRRVRAFADQSPAAGCYRSHMKALEEARRLGGLVHILEDDSILSAALLPFMNDRLPALLDQFDLLFLDMWIDQDHAAVTKFQAAMDGRDGLLPLDQDGPRIACASSYVVAPRFVDELHRLLRDHQSSRRPVDSTYDHLAKSNQCRAAVVVPFVTGVDIQVGAASDIQPMPPAHQRMYTMLRTHFFVDKSRQPSL